ncbi:unnamed protein product [Hydatigera taeniaeformis]|uniref:Polyprenal reductase n=1 Tax=Hydatigena taeniaeformis TaxID=6205 RepID=A0A0R3X6I2_HYDTA|nr:unnamed protein product [Hydatigera taeniaeformis]
MLFDDGANILECFVIYAYVLSSFVSFATIWLYRFPQMGNSVFLFRTIFLFGKCAPNYGRIYTVLQVPKRFFVHFYVTAVIVSLSTILFVLHCHSKRLEEKFNAIAVMLWQFCCTGSSIGANIGLFVMFCHALKRLYENLYVHLFSDSKMSIAHYFIGHFFYLTMSPCIYWSSQYAGYSTTAILLDFILDKRGMVAIIAYIFLAFLTMALQHLVMRQLASTRLRASKGYSFLERRNAYLMPEGYMFTYVTCPHFSLEITLYMLTHAFLGLRWMPFTAVLLFVLSNQLCSAVINHLWYLENYPKFAQSRKMLIPFVL